MLRIDNFSNLGIFYGCVKDNKLCVVSNNILNDFKNKPYNLKSYECLHKNTDLKNKIQCKKCRFGTTEI